MERRPECGDRRHIPPVPTVRGVARSGRTDEKTTERTSAVALGRDLGSSLLVGDAAQDRTDTQRGTRHGGNDKASSARTSSGARARSAAERAAPTSSPSRVFMGMLSFPYYSTRVKFNPRQAPAAARPARGHSGPHFPERSLRHLKLARAAGRTGRSVPRHQSARPLVAAGAHTPRPVDEDEDIRVTSEPRFRTDLFRGTAAYYERYRSPYPDALFDDLRRRLPVSGRGRLLDLACGTGQIGLPLAGHFAEVVCVDQEPEMVGVGRAKAEASGIGNIRWHVGIAETVVLDQPFELITVGNAFQRLDRKRVASRMLEWLQPGGGVALLWGDSPWRGKQPWQKAMDDLLGRWMARLGATDRVPSGWEAAMLAEPHHQVLRDAGFVYVGKFEFQTNQAWTVESLIGFVYSTSFLNRHALGDQATAFELDLTESLSRLGVDDSVSQPACYAYELARKR
jgi:ubiquinone/menaquinone biosynthesis C-methylase UbiE